jgi:hypothetical protein
MVPHHPIPFFTSRGAIYLKTISTLIIFYVLPVVSKPIQLTPETRTKPYKSTRQNPTFKTLVALQLCFGLKVTPP